MFDNASELFVVSELFVSLELFAPKVPWGSRLTSLGALRVPGLAGPLNPGFVRSGGGLGGTILSSFLRCVVGELLFESNGLDLSMAEFGGATLRSFGLGLVAGEPEDAGGDAVDPGVALSSRLPCLGLSVGGRGFSGALFKFSSGRTEPGRSAEGAGSACCV